MNIDIETKKYFLAYVVCYRQTEQIINVELTQNEIEKQKNLQKMRKQKRLIAVDGVSQIDTNIVTKKKKTIYNNYYTSISFSERGIPTHYGPLLDINNPQKYSFNITEIDSQWAKYYADMYGLLFCYQSFESLNGPPVESQTGEYIIPKTVNAARYLLNNLESNNVAAQTFIKEYEDLVNKLQANTDEQYKIQVKVVEGAKQQTPATPNSQAVDSLNKLYKQYDDLTQKLQDAVNYDQQTSQMQGEILKLITNINKSVEQLHSTQVTETLVTQKMGQSLQTNYDETAKKIRLMADFGSTSSNYATMVYNFANKIKSTAQLYNS